MLHGAFQRTIETMPQWDAAQKARRDQGEPVRMAILRETLRRRNEREPSSTWAELGSAVGVAGETAKYHCRVLRRRGWVDFQDGRPRTLVLTEAGEAAIQPEG